MASNTRTEGEKEEHLLLIAKYLVRGWSYQQMANELSISKSQVAYDVKKLRDYWRTEQMDAYQQYILQELFRLGEMEAELWQAWEDSKKAMYSTTLKTVGEDNDDSRERMVTHKTQNGNPSYMALIIKISEQRTKLLGLNAPEKLDIQSSNETGYTYSELQFYAAEVTKNLQEVERFEDEQ